MHKLLVSSALTTSVVIAGSHRFRRDMARARERVSQVPCAVVETSFGALEYAAVGEGEPVLAVHGIFGGRDQGLASFGGLLPDRRVLAPSRFGYLGSSLPPGATPAWQAEAFAELLDALGIDQIDVIGYSAGSVSSLQLALRHPSRVRTLSVMCGDWPGAAAVAPPPAVKVPFRSDALMWLATTLAGPSLLRFIAGVPRDFELNPGDRANARRMVDLMFPVRERSDGVIFDAYVGNPDVNGYPLENIAVPTLVVHSQDDTMASYASARAAAQRIPGALLVTHPSGGHLMLGQHAVTQRAVLDFLGSTVTERGAGGTPA